MTNHHPPEPEDAGLTVRCGGCDEALHVSETDVVIDATDMDGEGNALSVTRTYFCNEEHGYRWLNRGRAKRLAAMAEEVEE